MAYRQEFRKDIVIDYMCFRKWGHNELDEPSFTQPTMYNTIRNRESIPDLYAVKIVVRLHTSYMFTLTPLTKIGRIILAIRGCLYTSAASVLLFMKSVIFLFFSFV